MTNQVSFVDRSFVRSSVAIGHLHNHEVAENENAIAFDIAFAMKTHVRSHIQRVMDRSLNNETISTMKKFVLINQFCKFVLHTLRKLQDSEKTI
jgi:hypothetical protein